MALVAEHFNCGFWRKPEVNIGLTVITLQYSSQILKYLCAFPLPQCWFGYYSRLSAPKYAWLNIGEGEGYIWERTKVWWRLILRNFRENSRKTVSVSTICDEYCRIYLNLLWMTLLAGRHKTVKLKFSHLNQFCKRQIWGVS